MEKYPKLFVKVSILYLLFGVVFGLLMATRIVSGLNYTFVHVHFNLVGFMSMMIFGISYHILPRFNARPLKWPGLVPVHFYGVNIGLIGMLFAYLIGGFWSSDWRTMVLHIFATVTALSIILFIVNIYTVLISTSASAGTAPAPVAVQQQVKAEEVKDTITSDLKVSHVLEKWPNLLPVFIDSGFKAMSNPAARATFAKMITIKQACKVHNVELDSFVKKLNDALNGNGSRITALPKVAPFKTVMGKIPQQSASPTIKRGDKCAKDILIGDLISSYPETKKIFERHYGAGCFSCPGHATESVAQTALMHNISPDLILKEINDEIDNVLGSMR
jgi:cytochrome c oxidase cbb3-type subunit 1